MLKCQNKTTLSSYSNFWVTISCRRWFDLTHSLAHRRLFFDDDNKNQIKNTTKMFAVIPCTLLALMFKNILLRGFLSCLSSSRQDTRWNLAFCLSAPSDVPLDGPARHSAAHHANQLVTKREKKKPLLSALVVT